jgi:hypothetical protein
MDEQLPRNAFTTGERPNERSFFRRNVEPLFEALRPRAGEIVDADWQLKWLWLSASTLSYLPELGAKARQVFAELWALRGPGVAKAKRRKARR